MLFGWCLISESISSSHAYRSLKQMVGSTSCPLTTILLSSLAFVQILYVNCLGDLSLPRKSVVMLTDRPDMTLDVYRGHKTTTQQQILYKNLSLSEGTYNNLM